MTYLRALTTDGETVYLNTDKILSITPYPSRLTILLGAGLYWHVDPETVEFVALQDVVQEVNS